MNIWALPKEPAIRVALLRLAAEYDLRTVSLDCRSERDRQAIRLCDRHQAGLNAYFYTYGQTSQHYGLQLDYPTDAPGGVPYYNALEELPLDRLIELLSLHFELT